MRSVQTHLVTLRALSAMWVFLQAKKRGVRARYTKTSKGSRAAAARKKTKRGQRRGQQRRQKGKRQAPQRRGWGGAWRAWVRIRCQGVRPRPGLLAELANEYKASKEAQTEEYKVARALGASMTRVMRLRAADGSVKPPLPPGQRRLDQFRALGTLLANAECGTSKCESAMAYCMAAREHGAIASEMLTIARASQRHVANTRKEAQQERASLLAAYEVGLGRRAADEIASALAPFPDRRARRLPP